MIFPLCNLGLIYSSITYWTINCWRYLSDIRSYTRLRISWYNWLKVVDNVLLSDNKNKLIAKMSLTFTLYLCNNDIEWTRLWARGHTTTMIAYQLLINPFVQWIKLYLYLIGLHKSRNNFEIMCFLIVF